MLFQEHVLDNFVRLEIGVDSESLCVCKCCIQIFFKFNFKTFFFNIHEPLFFY